MRVVAGLSVLVGEQVGVENPAGVVVPGREDALVRGRLAVRVFLLFQEQAELVAFLRVGVEV